MVETYQVPRIGELPGLDGLSREQPDYVAKLEDGLRRLDDLVGEQRVHCERLFDDSASGIVAQLNEIPGFSASKHRDAKELKQYLQREGLSSDSVPDFGPDEAIVYSFGMKPSAIGTESRRRFEDTMSSAQRAVQDQTRTLADNYKAVQRRREDFYDKLMELTEVTPLTEVGLGLNEVHFFVPRADGVYESLFSIGGTSSPHPTLRPNYRKEWFSDAKFLQSFMEQSQGLNAAYLVKNPSESVDMHSLVSRGLNKFFIDYSSAVVSEVERRRQERTERTPEQVLRDGIGKRED